MSEYLRCAPKYTISRLNKQKFSDEGTHTPQQAEGHSSLHPTPPSTLTTWRLDFVPSPKYFPLELHLIATKNWIVLYNKT